MEIRCPNCGKTGKISEEKQHKRIKCKACGEEFVPADAIAMLIDESIPEPLVDLEETMMVEEEDVEMAAPLPRIPLPPDPKSEMDSENEIEISSIPLSSSSPLIAEGNEPWFYGFLQFLAICFVILACLAGVVGGIPLLAILTSSKGLADVLITLVVGLLWFFGPVVGLLTCASVILLLVDYARNIRRIRINSDRRMLD